MASIQYGRSTSKILSRFIKGTWSTVFKFKMMEKGPCTSYEMDWESSSVKTSEPFTPCLTFYIPTMFSSQT